MFGIVYQYIYHFVNLWWSNGSCGYVPHPTQKYKYFVTYEFEGKPYRMLIAKKRGPPHVVSIRGQRLGDDDAVDVYADIKSYLGPNMDFHGIEYTPNCLGYTRLVFCFSDDSEREFTDNNVIQL